MSVSSNFALTCSFEPPVPRNKRTWYCPFWNTDADGGDVDELATLRPLADDWIKECYRAYHELVPKSDPEEDWDARNALYATSVCFIGSYAILL